MISAAARATLDFLTNRKRAYRSVFDKDSAHAEKVLDDLAQFCRAHETTHSPDERTSAMLEGRREVWLRIQHHIQMDDDQLWDHYTGGKSKN